MGTAADRRNQNPAVAYNERDNEYLVVWEERVEPTSNPPRIFARRVDAATGQPIGREFSVTGAGVTGRMPAVAFNNKNTEFLVVWEGDRIFIDQGRDLTEVEIFGQRLEGATAIPKSETDLRISHLQPDGDPRFDALDPAVAYNSLDNEYLVVWEGDMTVDERDNDEEEIFGQLLDGATGVEKGINDFRISFMGQDGDTRFEALDPAIAYDPVSNTYLVVWDGEEEGNGLFDDHDEVFAQQVQAATGQLLGNRVRLSEMGPDGVPGEPIYSIDKPTLAFSSGEGTYLVVWEGSDDNPLITPSDKEIYGQRYAPEISPDPTPNPNPNPDPNPNPGGEFTLFLPLIVK